MFYKVAIYFICTNILLFAGYITYGNDTGKWDIQYRDVASSLLAAGDFPWWSPRLGEGTPQLTVQWVSWVANPLGLLLGTLRPYDHLSFVVENLVWRVVGFVGVFLFARQWTGSTPGSISIAASYVGSGVMSWAALSYSAFIGQMLAPWVLTASGLITRAHSPSLWLQGIGVAAIAGSSMVWMGYPGTWISAVFVSIPFSVLLSFMQIKGFKKLLFSIFLIVILMSCITAILLSETLSVENASLSFNYRVLTQNMNIGKLRGIDLVGIFLANPSYLPTVSSPTMQPVYFGIFPVLFIIITSVNTKKSFNILFIMAVLFVSFVQSSFDNWNIGSHPLYKDIPSLSDFSGKFPWIDPLMFFVIPIGLVAWGWRVPIPNSSIDYIFLSGILWILLISSDNIFANFLRQYIHPFTLVRYNYLYVWLVALFTPVVAWRRFDSISVSLRTSADGTQPRAASSSLVHPMLWGGAAALLTVTLIGLTSSDVVRFGASATGASFMGGPQLFWQAAMTIFGSFFATVYFLASYFNKLFILRMTGPLATVITITASIALILVGMYLRANEIAIPSVPVTPFTQLLLDLLHSAIIIILIAVTFNHVRTRASLQAVVSAILIWDISIAVPRYFSDNENISAPQFSRPLRASQTDTLYWFEHFSGSGEYKTDLTGPFSLENPGLMKPSASVTNLQLHWGILYNKWIEFPSSWTHISGSDVSVALENLEDGVLPVSCTTGQQAVPLKSTGRVRILLASSVEATFTAGCDRLLVFTDSWAPGWSATIDGIPTPVLRVNNAIRGVMVPAGEHALQWRYRPRFLAPLLALLAAGLAISGILIAAPWWSRRFPIPMSPRLDRLLGFGPLPPEEILGPTLAPLPNTPAPAISPASTDAPARDWQRLPAMWRHGLPIALPLTGLAILVLISVTAYDPRIDGPTQGFRLFLFRSVLAGLWAWIVIAGRTGFRSPVGPSLMLLVLLPPLVLQVARHTYRFQAGTPLATIATDFRSPSWQSTWEVTNRGNAPGDPGSNGTILRNDGPNAMAITFATTPIPKDLWPWWRRPLGRIGPGPVDVAWTAMLDRSGPYYTVATLGRLTIQALKNGYLVTAPVSGGDVRGDFVEVPDTGQPGPVRWLLRIDPDAGASLFLDDRPSWKGGHPGMIERITLGDASNDPEHRGSMTITDASIVQRVALTAQ